MGHIVIVSGPPGAGKSTVARMLAENSPYERSIHIHTDDFYGYIRKGYIEPWKPESNEQNIVVSNAMASCAESFVGGGYEVFLDGIVGPWHLNSWVKTSQCGINVHYVILRPNLEMTISRNANREKEVALNVITHMWNGFSDLGLYESHVIDTTGQSPEESVIEIRKMVSSERLRI